MAFSLLRGFFTSAVLHLHGIFKIKISDKDSSLNNTSGNSIMSRHRRSHIQSNL